MAVNFGKPNNLKISHLKKKQNAIMFQHRTKLSFNSVLVFI